MRAKNYCVFCRFCIKIKKTDDVNELKKKYKVKVYFPVTPFVSNDELRKLYEQGIISWKSYGQYALRNISLPLEDLEKKAPPIDALLFEKPKEKVEQPKGAKEEGAEETSKKRKAEDKPDNEKDKKVGQNKARWDKTRQS